MKDDLIFPSRPLKSSSSDSGGYVKEGVHQKIKNFNQLQFCLHNQPSGLLYPKTIPYSASPSIVFTSPSRSVLHIKKSSAEF